ncbi:MAG: hypothetical protein JOZ96_11765 [Acidobacteria bacterium]|nr:hypothetical protein [Acidobacteriota bacterium]
MRLRNLPKLLALTFFLGLTHFSQTTAFGQCPENGGATVQGNGWEKGTTVRVFIDPAITGDARTATEQAFRNWNAASNSFANNSHVTYEFTTTRPTSGVGNYLIVSPGSNLIDPESGSQVRAQTTYITDPNNGYTSYGGIRLDPSMTNYDAVLETMVHEIGHPMGLGHCTGSGCTPQSSVMTPVVVNPPTPANFNRAYGRSTIPTDCDNNRLQTVNYPACSPPIDSSCDFWDPNLCTCRGYSGGGGSGGGGDAGGGFDGGYCTPYYWVYMESWDGGKTWNIVDVSYAGCW